jgi:hypothetical protein
MSSEMLEISSVFLSVVFAPIMRVAFFFLSQKELCKLLGKHLRPSCALHPFSLLQKELV